MSNIDPGRRLALPGQCAPARVTRALLAFLQGMYEAGPVGYRWCADVGTTDIIIRKGSVSDPAELPKFPAILAQDGQYRWLTTVSPVVKTDPKKNKVTSNQLVYQVTVQIVADDESVAESVGWAIYSLVPRFKEVLSEFSVASLHGIPSADRVSFQSPVTHRSYPGMIITLPLAVAVQLTSAVGPSDGIFDNARHRAKTVLEQVDASEEISIQGLTQYDQDNHPVEVTDPVLDRGPGSTAPVPEPTPPDEFLYDNDVDLTPRRNPNG